MESNQGTETNCHSGFRKIPKNSEMHIIGLPNHINDLGAFYEELYHFTHFS